MVQYLHWPVRFDPMRMLKYTAGWYKKNLVRLAAANNTDRVQAPILGGLLVKAQSTIYLVVVGRAAKPAMPQE